MSVIASLIEDWNRDLDRGIDEVFDFIRSFGSSDRGIHSHARRTGGRRRNSSPQRSRSRRRAASATSAYHSPSPGQASTARPAYEDDYESLPVWYYEDESTHASDCTNCMKTGQPISTTKLRYYGGASQSSPRGTLKSSMAQALCWDCGSRLVDRGHVRPREGRRSHDRPPSSGSGSGSREGSKVRIETPERDRMTPRQRSYSESGGRKQYASPELPSPGSRLPETPSIRVHSTSPAPRGDSRDRYHAHGSDSWIRGPGQRPRPRRFSQEGTADAPRERPTYHQDTSYGRPIDPGRRSGPSTAYWEGVHRSMPIGSHYGPRSGEIFPEGSRRRGSTRVSEVTSGQGQLSPHDVRTHPDARHRGRPFRTHSDPDGDRGRSQHTDRYL